VVVFVGYHYLSTQMYRSLKRQLPQFRFLYVFAKDTIGSDANFRLFDRSAMKAEDPDYVELAYDPPWFREWPRAWQSQSRAGRALRWARWSVAFVRYKREIRKLIATLRPDLFVTTTDLFFAPRYVARKFPRTPLAIVQPCYLDLWDRPERFSILRLVVNFLQPGVFARQEYFGLEIPGAPLLVWDPDSHKTYRDKGRAAVRVVSPAHLDIREQAAQYREQTDEILAELGLGAPVVSVFPAYYGDVKGHGDDYQKELEQALVEVVERLSGAFTVVLKVHPNEEPAYWRRVFAQVSGRESVRMVTTIDRFKLMAVSEYHISTNSYSAVEATLSGAVAVNFVPGMHRIGETLCAQFSRNAALVFTSTEELTRTILAAPHGRRSFTTEISSAERQILGAPGESRDVADVFQELLRR
jgi:hypothetical protein